MSRSRQPRANHNQDADEEKRLWSQIKAEAKKIDGLIVCCAILSTGCEIIIVSWLTDL